jgi:hypothetical protein
MSIFTTESHKRYPGQNHWNNTVLFLCLRLPPRLLRSPGFKLYLFVLLQPLNSSVFFSVYTAMDIERPGHFIGFVWLDALKKQRSPCFRASWGGGTLFQLINYSHLLYKVHFMKSDEEARKMTERKKKVNVLYKPKSSWNIDGISLWNFDKTLSPGLLWVLKLLLGSWTYNMQPYRILMWLSLLVAWKKW